MSHFPVIVIGDDIESQLQPYHEYECTGVEDQYVIDVDRTVEAKEEYKKFGDDYGSFEEFASDWFGAVVRDGRVITRTNPNSKWDWWVVGGRWSGWLGKDHGKRGQFDLDQLRGKAAIEAGLRYDRIRPKGIEPPTLRWAEWREASADIDTARKTWWEHPFNAAVREAEAWADPDEFAVDHMTFMSHARQSAVVPFAMVAEGVWRAKGEMGWFATVSDERAGWNEFANQFLDAMPDDVMLTVVDCHV